MTMVAFLTRSANLVITEDTAFDWDLAPVMDAGYAHWAIGDPTKLYIDRTGWYWAGGNFTTLGTDYGGASNANWVAAIGKNGVTLADTIVAERHEAVSGAKADLMSIGSPVYLLDTDYVQVFFQNTNGTTLLVEANVSDGVPSGYLADAGTHVLSPHLFLIAMAGSAPA